MARPVTHVAGHVPEPPQHAAEHHAGVMGGAHEPPADHGTSHATSTGYFAVLVEGISREELQKRYAP
jgi:hypothetical protein